MKKNGLIELTRIIGCAMVILLHIRLGYTSGNEFIASNLWIYCLVRDGVSLFWIIQGFFLMNGKSYKNILKRTATKIVFPAFAFMFFSAVFSERLLGGGTRRYFI